MAVHSLRVQMLPQWSTARRQLFQQHADAFGTVEQPPQVKAGEGIVGMKPDNCGESRHGGSVASLELCKRGSIVGRRRSLSAR